MSNKKNFRSNLKLLQGGRLEEYNQFLKEFLQERGISASVEFNLDQLQQLINQEGTFGKGLVAYLKKLEKELDKITDDKDLKLLIFQIVSELGSLVFPNTSACYSIIPNDLKKIKWEDKLQAFNNVIENRNPDIKKIKPLLNLFLTQKYPQSLVCLVALCLSEVLASSLNKKNGLLVDEKGQYVGQEEAMRPRLKASMWIDQLSWKIRVHLHGLKKSAPGDQKKVIEWYSFELAKAITDKVLLNQKLFASYKTIQANPLENGAIKTPAYYAWTGSNLLALPKTLALPMVYPPRDWEVNNNAHKGGYHLSSLTEITYQGYLDSKSSRIHKHRLSLKEINHLNSLQRVKFTMNERMVTFYKKYQDQLTDAEVVLLADKWVYPSDDLVLEINNKWAKMFDSPTTISNSITKELVSKKNDTLRNQETLLLAQLYCNKDLYWPVVQDFRGRVYRIGHLNIQLNEFVRSLLAFSSNKPLVNRKKNKYTMAKFNLLLKEVLVEKDLIEKWDNFFGNRFINNEKFEELLLEDLLAKKLSLIQIGQLLLIRQGAYDRVGVYYDASASAYQIMGSINGDRGLCQLTNVLKSENTQKKDIYSFFLEELKKTNENILFNKDEKGLKRYKDFFKKNFDRSLAKTIIMPLIYGKKAIGFSEDLEAFFAKGKLFPKRSIRVKLASTLLKILKEHSMLAKANHFMKLLRSIGKFLFDLDLFIIRGPYSSSHIVYNKEEIQKIRLYLKKGKRYQVQQINISRIVKDQTGEPLKAKTKTINAFVANYIHFLDGVICHYIIKKLEQESVLALGTIHDCFFIKPSQAKDLKKLYKEGLVLALIVHQYNLLYWFYDIMQSMKVKGFDYDYFFLSRKEILDNLEALQRDENFISMLDKVVLIDTDNLIETLQFFKDQESSLKMKSNWADLCGHLKANPDIDILNIMKEIVDDPTESLFSDNA